MMSESPYAVQNLPVDGAVSFFLEHGVKVLTPAGFDAFEGVYFIIGIATLLLIVVLLFVDDTTEGGKHFGGAVLLVWIGGWLLLYLLRYVELYVFETGAWIAILVALLIGTAYKYRKRRFPFSKRPQATRTRKTLVPPKNMETTVMKTPSDTNATPIAPARAKKIAAGLFRQKQRTAMEELESLPALGSVKEQVRDVAAFARTQLLRVRSGYGMVTMGQHLVFTGKPGTGKTTVARIIGRIYKELGLLSTGQFVEVGGRDLIAEWIGQTAPKVHEFFMKALGGVLFIDEAYALAAVDSFRDFGPEALATLLKLMEDHRDNIIVILAGYENEMEILLSKNPGLRSRFKTQIHFADYTTSELTLIFEGFCRENSYTLTHDAKVKAEKLFAELYTARDKNFGNGRTARNVFERSIMKQARRISAKKDASRQDLLTLYSADIPTRGEVKL